MRNVLVHQRIEELKARREKAVDISARDVVRGLMKEAKREGEGSSHSARVAAWDKLGKHCGIYEVDHAQSSLINVRSLEALTDEQLAMLASGKTPPGLP